MVPRFAKRTHAFFRIQERDEKRTNVQAESASVVEPSLDPVETTVRFVPGTRIYGGGDFGFELFDSHRHSCWAGDRGRVVTALAAADQTPSRQRAFANCGRGGWVLKRQDKPGEYAVVPKYCHDRFCVPCARQRAFVVQKNLSSQLPDEPLRFVTLTLRSKTEPLKELVDRLRDSFTKLRKHPFWTKHVLGGVGFIEVKWAKHAERWHPHLHLLTHGTFIDQAQLSKIWNDITGGSFIVDVRLVRDRKDALRYVTKYATKGWDPETFRHPDRLAECIRAMKGRKLCHAFGDWSKLCLTRADTEGDWSLLCSLHELGRLCREGDADALLVEQAINRDGRTADVYHHSAHPPPEFYAVQFTNFDDDLYRLICRGREIVAECIRAEQGALHALELEVPRPRQASLAFPGRW